MKLFELNFVTLMWRFYMLMAVVIIAFFAGIPWLSILALPILLSALMGMKFSKVQTSAKPKPAPKRTSSYAPHQAVHN